MGRFKVVQLTGRNSVFPFTNILPLLHTPHLDESLLSGEAGEVWESLNKAMKHYEVLSFSKVKKGKEINPLNYGCCC